MDLWRSEFGADASIAGKRVILNRIPFTVIGVAPPGFQGSDPIPSQFWAPVNLQSSLFREPDCLADDSQSWLGLLGRSKRGISTKQTRDDLGVIAGQIGHSQLGQTAVKWSHAPHKNWRIRNE